MLCTSLASYCVRTSEGVIVIQQKGVGPIYSNIYKKGFQTAVDSNKVSYGLCVAASRALIEVTITFLSGMLGV